MNRLLVAGKLLAAVFWGVILVNLVEPLAQPFAALLNLACGIVLLIHCVELWLFADRIGDCRQPGLARAQVLLFGVFYALTLPRAPAAQALPEGESLAAEGAYGAQAQSAPLID
ncbi:DUF1145 domain-containing protein [Pseudomonas zhanjiangensis]|uniref:DUF1145 domain-containing protein n=1 Tax=Pseudomonas zhanjiangensis TaxID=3239015 RepID=A0ABV3YUZ9_9PSED